MLSKIKSVADNEKFKSADVKIKNIFQKTLELCKKTYQACNNSFNIAGKALHNMGVSANTVSVTGFVIGLLAINFLSLGLYGYALVCILFNRACDILDYMFYAGIIFGFALANPQQNAVAAIFLMFGFTAAAATLLSYAVIAYKNNVPQQPEVRQSPFYLGGFAQGFETLIALVILCIVPSLFMPIAIILGCLSFVKAFSVMVTAYYNFVIAPHKSSAKNKDKKAS